MVAVMVAVMVCRYIEKSRVHNVRVLVRGNEKSLRMLGPRWRREWGLGEDKCTVSVRVREELFSFCSLLNSFFFLVYLFVSLFPCLFFHVSSLFCLLSILSFVGQW
jgi:hypothetical protein